jgi:hypothetical protein
VPFIGIWYKVPDGLLDLLGFEVRPTPHFPMENPVPDLRFGCRVGLLTTQTIGNIFYRGRNLRIFCVHAQHEVHHPINDWL